MADPARRRAQNAAGPWFVDETCIDCGTCMWMAPEAFHDAGGKSAVHAQPPDRDEAASAALLSCPTGSIGGPVAQVDFPRPAGPEGVWHMGFHDRRSFGATAWLVRTSAGNVLVDVPRFVPRLVKAVEAMGGVDHIVLSHRDDVAAHQEWHDHFGAPRVIHGDDAVIEAETLLSGPGGEVAGLAWTHVPGHTKGSVVYRHEDILFTGDHLSASIADPARLRASRRACWYDWGVQTDSMRLHADWPIAHILPGHGAPWHGTPAAYRSGMADLIAWMERSG